MVQASQTMSLFSDEVFKKKRGFQNAQDNEEFGKTEYTEKIAE